MYLHTSYLKTEQKNTCTDILQVVQFSSEWTSQKGLASHADNLRALSCVSVSKTSAEMSGYKHKPIAAHSLLRGNLFVDK